MNETDMRGRQKTAPGDQLARDGGGGDRPNLRWLVAPALISLLLAGFWVAASGDLAWSLFFLVLGGWPLSLSLIAFLAAAVALGSKRGPLSARGWRLWLWLAAAVLSALVPALDSNWQVRLLNLPVLALVCMLAYDRVCASGDFPTSLGSLGHALSNFVTQLFSNLRTVGLVFGRVRSGVLEVVLGLVAAAVVLTVTVPLLAEVDPVFSEIVRRAWGPLRFDNPWMVAWRLFRLVVISALVFSLALGALRGSSRPGPSAGGSPRRAVSTLGAATALCVIDACYLVFVFVDAAYLFGGAGPDRVADYARSGFFQLVGVATVNLIVLAAASAAGGRERGSRTFVVTELALVAVTTVMLASSAWRMSLYVGEYGLSLLRLMTYFGMVAVLSLLVLATVRILRPQTRVFEAGLICVVGLWLAFALARPVHIVAGYNVDGYVRHELSRIDVDYLAGLGYDSYGPLLRLAREEPALRGEVSDAIERSGDDYGRVWACLSLPEALDGSFAGR